MKRRVFVKTGLGAALAPFIGDFAASERDAAVPIRLARAADRRLAPPARGNIRVAFAVAQNTNVMDLAGPWEVFQDVHVPGRGATHADQMPFELYTVAESREVIEATGGLQLVPDFTVDDAPRPHVVVVPASRAGRPLHRWLADVSSGTDVTMSVCTGAFQLGRAGLLDGLRVTTHHDFYDSLADEFPAAEVVRGLRYVENERISTAGGLTSGIDLALRVVARYFGHDVASATAQYMEYVGVQRSG